MTQSNEITFAEYYNAIKAMAKSPDDVYTAKLTAINTALALLGIDVDSDAPEARK